MQWGYRARPPVRRHAPQCNGGLFAGGVPGPGDPGIGRQLASPHFEVRASSRWGSPVGGVGTHSTTAVTLKLSASG